MHHGRKPGVPHLGCCQQSGVTGTARVRDGRPAPAAIASSPLQPSGRSPEHAWPFARLRDEGARSRRPACRDPKGVTVVGGLMNGLSWRSDPIRNVPLLLGVKLLPDALPDGRGGFCSPEGTFERNTHHVVKDNRPRQGFPQLSWTHDLNTSDYISAASASQPPEGGRNPNRARPLGQSARPGRRIVKCPYRSPSSCQRRPRGGTKELTGPDTPLALN
jgi:hypothetical protein